MQKAQQIRTVHSIDFKKLFLKYHTRWAALMKIIKVIKEYIVFHFLLPPCDLILEIISL